MQDATQVTHSGGTGEGKPKLLDQLREALSPLKELDSWIRRRLRCYLWKQWGRRGYRELRNHGVSRDLAWNTAKSAPGPWRLSRSPGLAFALPASYFVSLGVPTLYVKGSSQPNRRGTRSVCPVVWEEGSREAPPYPDSHKDDMTTIERLQEWYSRQCNGEWEHRYGVKVDSCDNPGWWVKIDLVGTSLEHASFVRVAHGVNEVGFATESDWIDCKVTEAIFEGAGDAGKLETIFTIFLDWKDRCEHQGGGYSPPAARSSKPTP